MSRTISTRLNNWFNNLSSEKALGVVLCTALVLLLALAGIVGFLSGSWLGFAVAICAEIMVIGALGLCMAIAESANTI